MKTYSELLEAIKKPDGKKVFDKKIKRIPVQVYKERMRTNPFVAYVDGDRLDAFRTEKDAVKAAETVIKELT